MLKGGLFFIILIAWTGTVASLSAADYLLLQTPSDFIIFDQYQQRIRMEKLRALPEGMPFRIENELTKLSDNYTDAIQTSSLQTSYYILADDNGNPVSPDGLAGNYRLFRNVLSLGDSVVSTTALKMTGSSGEEYLIKPKSKLRRIFRSGSKIYVRMLTFPYSFGWMEQEHLRQGSNPFKISRQSIITEEIIALVGRFNRTLKILYETYRPSENDIPHWQAQTTPSEIQLTFKSNDPRFLPRESIRIFSGQIRKIVRNENRIVYNTDSEIRIRFDER